MKMAMDTPTAIGGQPQNADAITKQTGQDPSLSQQHQQRLQQQPQSVVIDLTGDSPPTSPRVATRDKGHEERPAKRQRVAIAPRLPQLQPRLQPQPTPGPPLSLNDCIKRYVITALDRKFDSFAAIEPAFDDLLDTRKLGNKIIRVFAADTMFLAQYNASQGYLSQEYQAQLQAQVGEYVNTLMGDPSYGHSTNTNGHSSRSTSSIPQQTVPTPNQQPQGAGMGWQSLSKPRESYAVSDHSRPHAVSGQVAATAGQHVHLPIAHSHPPALAQHPAPVQTPTPVQPTHLPSTAKTQDVLPPKITTPLQKSGSKTKLRAAFRTNLVSPLGFRSHARATAWKYKRSVKPERASKDGAARHSNKGTGAWASLPKRPYLALQERRSIQAGAAKLIQLPLEERKHSVCWPYHVDFTEEEVEVARQAVRKYLARQPQSGKMALREIRRFARKHPEHICQLANTFALKDGLSRRDQVSISNFFEDAAANRVNRHKVAIRLELDELDEQNARVRACRIPSLLFAREVDGNRGFGRTRKLVNFTNEFRKALEDELESRGDWNNCAGDIMTITWVSDHSFLCGATAHSDSHNQQYNKPGNLLLYSPSDSRLQAYADHRFPRPVIESGENSTEAMRESQDPWLYASVVSSTYDAMRDRAYTSSFDKTVKIWKVDKFGARMDCLGTWPHRGHVNFVEVSKQIGWVATAADVPHEAVRLYVVNDNDVSMSGYIPLSGTRAWNEDDKETQAPQKWSYYPATMRWGIAKDVQHFLLVGYSPRSITGDDNDIPFEKRNSGEICLWNCKTGKSVKVMTGSSQNVFEVAWHPTQPCFIVASSPFGKHFDDRVKTQIRIFTPADVPELYGAFNEVQCLDCPASDINELTIMPCSLSCCYITAAATDGNVYVWDTARGDNPIHVLRHGNPIGDDVGNYDTGVKFTAWGTSQDRFYTGGSDGMVKVWNVRNRKKPLVRDLLQVDAPISSGVFSPNRAKLAIGDASGRVSLLSVDKADDQPAKYIQIPAATQSLVHTTARSIRVPKNFTPHPTPPPPVGTESESGIDRAWAYVVRGNLQIHKNRCIGAVQGPAYAALGFYRSELHKDGDPNQPLLAATEAKQQENETMFRSSGRVRRLRVPEPASPPLNQQHQRNQALVLDLRALPESTQLELAMEGVKLDDPLEAQDWDFEYEEE
ncbi:hypothetical protein BN1723_012114 [Verticillium longisporum]|uniref:Uncharacterized protein n=1 Tax=Verticillium longisporum TaxID=100787 RepID=A0A0G4LKE0_VERLO|nr:hypothetical protein BN1723_012114 [Verticillium longisporum]CRK22384.1 hypothetical protein BN1708_013419 [Verticillium longisporum]